MYFFFFNDTATTEIYTLSLHDALPISVVMRISGPLQRMMAATAMSVPIQVSRSEEHTSELQSPCNLVCRLLLEKKKKKFQSDVTSSRQLLGPPPIPPQETHPATTLPHV